MSCGLGVILSPATMRAASPSKNIQRVLFSIQYESGTSGRGGYGDSSNERDETWQRIDRSTIQPAALALKPFRPSQGELYAVRLTSKVVYSTMSIEFTENVREHGASIMGNFSPTYTLSDFFYSIDYKDGGQAQVYTEALGDLIGLEDNYQWGPGGSVFGDQLRPYLEQAQPSKTKEGYYEITGLRAPLNFDTGSKSCVLKSVTTEFNARQWEAYLPMIDQMIQRFDGDTSGLFGNKEDLQPFVKAYHKAKSKNKLALKPLCPIYASAYSEDIPADEPYSIRIWGSAFIEVQVEYITKQPGDIAIPTSIDAFDFDGNFAPLEPLTKNSGTVL